MCIQDNFIRSIPSVKKDRKEKKKKKTFRRNEKKEKAIKHIADIVHHHHALTSFPIDHTIPPPPIGRSNIQTATSQATRRINRRRCSACSFRLRSSSVCASCPTSSSSSDDVKSELERKRGCGWDGTRMLRGRRTLWKMMCRKAGRK